MRSINKVILIGNVGNAPEIRATNGGAKVATISLATSQRWTDAGGATQERVEWHRVIAWDGKKMKLATLIESYVKKGSPIYVDGAITYRQWTDKDNVVRYSTEITAREIVLLGVKPSSGSAPVENAAPAAPMTADDRPIDDDIPF